MKRIYTDADPQHCFIPCVVVVNHVSVPGVVCDDDVLVVAEHRGTGPVERSVDQHPDRLIHWITHSMTD